MSQVVGPDVKVVLSFATSVVEGSVRVVVPATQLGEGAEVEVAVAVSKETPKNDMDTVAQTASNMKNTLQTIANNIPSIVGNVVNSVINYVQQLAQQGIESFVLPARVQDMIVNQVETSLANSIQNNQFLQGAQFTVAAIVRNVQPVISSQVCQTAQAGSAP